MRLGESAIESLACKPHPIRIGDFNSRSELPYGCTVTHIYLAMKDFIDFLSLINTQLINRGMKRLETLLAAASFSSIVSEFMVMGLSKHCPSLVRNQYHNGHPDLLPRGQYAKDSAQHASQGIEVKASRYASGWQGHNPEDSWLMVFVFESNKRDDPKGTAVGPFRYESVMGAHLTRKDWRFSGRVGDSRRTITASVTKSGHTKMMANWIYRLSVQ